MGEHGFRGARLVPGQCDKDHGKLRELLYFSAHLSQCQQNWHPFEQY